MNKKIQTLFLCTGNSCRSQMAEGLCRHFHGDLIETASAGIKKQGLNSFATKVMAEIGIDISHQSSKTIEDLGKQEFDYVITVCDHAKESCPFFPARVKVLHHRFEDPPQLAANAKTEAEALEHYRRVRDEIKDFIQTLPQILKD